MKKRLVKIITAVVAAALALGLAYDRARAVFPKNFDIHVEKYAADAGLDPLLAYSLIKAESNFKEDALSKAGARGLMQLTPETFDFMMSKTPEKEQHDRDALFIAEINIKYGTQFLKYCIDNFENTDTALAAYNAGISRVKGWLSDAAYSDDGVTLHTIPYPETEGYVKKINMYLKIYRFLY